MTVYSVFSISVYSFLFLSGCLLAQRSFCYLNEKQKLRGIRHIFPLDLEVKMASAGGADLLLEGLGVFEVPVLMVLLSRIEASEGL